MSIEIMVICVLLIFVIPISLALWLTNRREERELELLYFKETGKLSARYLHGE